MRKIHPDFLFHLQHYDQALINNFIRCRNFILKIRPDCNEILYHTHALTNVFSVSDKLSGAFCAIPIYTKHFNLAFNKGTLLDDPKNLLQGTGKLIRHIPITIAAEYESKAVEQLIKQAIEIAENNSKTKDICSNKVISKIK